MDMAVFGGGYRFDSRSIKSVRVAKTLSKQRTFVGVKVSIKIIVAVIGAGAALSLPLLSLQFLCRKETVNQILNHVIANGLGWQLAVIQHDGITEQ